MNFAEEDFKSVREKANLPAKSNINLSLVLQYQFSIYESCKLQRNVVRTPPRKVSSLGWEREISRAIFRADLSTARQEKFSPKNSHRGFSSPDARGPSFQPIACSWWRSRYASICRSCSFARGRREPPSRAATKRNRVAFVTITLMI